MGVTRRGLLKGIVALGAAGGAVAGLSQVAAARDSQEAGPDDVGMLYDSTACIGCRACMTKCKQVNDLPPDIKEINGAPYDAPEDLSETTKNIIKLAKKGEDQAYVKMQCMHCIDPACVSVCMAGALHKKDNGVVAYDKTVCVGCRYCQVACPYDTPKFEWNDAFPLIVKCELCQHRDEGPGCCEVCPADAVIYGKYSDLQAEAKARIAANPDRYLDEVYGEDDGGGTHVLYLTSKEMPFEAIGMPALPDHPLPQMSESVQHTLYKGFLAPAALFGALTFVQFRNRKARKAGKGDEA